MRAFRTIAGAVSLVCVAMAAGCEKPRELTVANPVIRLAANPQAPAVAYFDVKGGPTPDRLLMVSSPLIIRAELHETMTTGNMTGMKPLTGVDIPANGEVRFEPGGKHVMLFNLNPSIKAGDTVQMNFTFASGTTMQAFAPVKSAGQLL